jgi:hypothetical protein
MRHFVKFCVSDIRQSQEWCCENSAGFGLIPLVTGSRSGRTGMRAACGVNAGSLVAAYYAKGISRQLGWRT